MDTNAAPRYLQIQAQADAAMKAANERELARPFRSHTVENYERNCRLANELARARGLFY